jgi:hypothetical protein
MNLSYICTADAAVPAISQAIGDWWSLPGRATEDSSRKTPVPSDTLAIGGAETGS